MHRTLLPLIVILLTGCPTEEPTPPGDLPCDADEAVVEVETEDDVTLVADYQPAATSGRGAVVLLHMIPPSNDRSGYPTRVREAIQDLDLSVLNLDRRGAGDSEGSALDAYEGDGGRLDVEAAVRFLLDDAVPCAVDPDRLVLVGASNGSTSVMDYLAEHDAALPDPAAAVWMSPGSYTENQNAISDHRAMLEATPLLWLFPTNEPYSNGFIDARGPDWEFVERGPMHGTRKFDGGDLEDNTVQELLDWFTSWGS